MASLKLFFLFVTLSIIVNALAQELSSSEDALSDEPSRTNERFDSSSSNARINVFGIKGGSSRSVKSGVKGGARSSTFTKGKSYDAGTKAVSSENHGTRFRGNCDSEPSAPLNGNLECSKYSGCRAVCNKDYKFPSGQNVMITKCQSGRWVPVDTNWDTIPACEPICSPECQNNGICINPGECQCADNYSGPQCQFSDAPCLNDAPLPVNSRRKCFGSKHCTIQCLVGHAFPDGSVVTNLKCKDGNWVPTRTDWVSVPDCEATCTPACQNGGNCLSLNVCQCPQEFRGPQCQYSADACDPEKIGFNGGYNCTGTSDSFSCSLNCPEGIEFEFPPVSHYTCTYDEGIFKPQSIPQCKLEAHMEIIQIGHDHSSFFKISNDSWSTQDIFGTISGSNQHGGVAWNSQMVDSKSSSKTSSNARGDQHFDFNAGHVNFGDLFHGGFGTNANGIVIVEQKRPEPAVCFTWGGTHYKTFDGKVFSFESDCSHILVQDAADGIFTITSSMSSGCKNGSSCSRIIKIFIERKEYTLSQNKDGIPEIRSKKKVLPIPTQIPGLRAEMVAHFLIVTLDSVGASIKWDGVSLVQIQTTESLWNRTAGLCGNMNGDPNDDLTNKDGSHPKSIATLASGWKVQDIGESCDEFPNLQHSCRNNEDFAADASAFCSKLLSERRFQACSTTMDLGILQNTCEWDYCACRDQDKRKCACDTMSVYVRQCVHKGLVTLNAWRDTEICPITCTGGRIYMACGPKSQTSCNTALTETSAADNIDCEEGCFCPQGSVLHKGTCITVEECPCQLRGRVFQPGATIDKDCNTCTCFSGKWSCTQAKCSARCAAIGDPHYTTFDGKHYDFMGKCSYYLIKGDDYSIEGENVACSGAISEAMGLTPTTESEALSCTKSVKIRINDVTIKLGQNHQLLINGEETTKLPLTAGGVKLRIASSIFLIAELPNGLDVWWDGISRVYINSPPEFHDKTKGLCGTFSMNQKDDFLTPDNDIEQAVVPFANKWKTDEQCPNAPNKEPNHPCEVNPQKRVTAEQYCSKLKTSLFSDCHWHVDPEIFHRDCMYDMCACETSITQCLCPILAAYAKECAHQGVKLSWRHEIEECKINCPAGQTYQVCGNSCTRSCSDISFDPKCKQNCVEGCNCPEGQTLNDKHECIPIGQCPCQYAGLEFLAGYREVRPGTKSQELCTCAGGLWNCKSATRDEIQNHPSASDMKSVCSTHKNQEITTCKPVEVKTCRNMHDVVNYSTTICEPGCVCKKDYVLDVPSGECVKETECPCYHGGKSYKEGSKMQEECNTCECNNGKWKCTDRICAGICSAWGDSHYTTFDGKLYEFQGACDYVLAKGSFSPDDSFDVSTQNVPCGTTGVTCSKSITLVVGSDASQETITLTQGKQLPKGNLNRIAIREAGLFVFLDVPDLGLVVQWDKGTRVYIRLNPKWKGRTKGLCGDYNNNAEDDFKTPSGGISEAAANIFGDSWRKQSYCSESKEITDTCAVHEERRIWAVKECNILKSSLFQACHTEVDVDPYLERCIFDTCGCDIGGDCECLCTALAAYSQECNTRGIPIKWRSQNLCPMQCDEKCSEYSPCISTCPRETCDNLVTLSENVHLCKQDSCIEGCLPKPCPAGEIYVNASYAECVPQATCKLLCMEIDGVSYYEGDQIEEDDCHSCVCSRGKKICRGVPCTTTTPVPVTFPMEERHKCIAGWTAWLNRDSHRKGHGKLIEQEPLPSTLDLFGIQGSAACTQDQMVDIRCRTVKDKRDFKETGLNVECSLERGLYCQAERGEPPCLDFEISVLCQCDDTINSTTTESSWVPVPPSVEEYPLCDVAQPNQPHPRDCSKFYQCTIGENGPELVEKACTPGTLYNSADQICDWPVNVISVRPECAESKTMTPIIATTENIVTAVCKDGEIWNECAIQCSRACLYYQSLLVQQGLCTENNDCIPGCVPVNRKECPSMNLWRDFNTCIDLADCTCKSNDNKPVKPGVIVKESECEICQCLNNHYTCDKSICDTTTSSTTTTEDTITTQAPISVCTDSNTIALIDGKAPLSDAAFDASTSLNQHFSPSNARLSARPSDVSGGSWVPEKMDENPWISVDLGHPQSVYGVSLKRSPFLNAYVKTYNVYYSASGNDNDYTPVTEIGSAVPKIFHGPEEENTVATVYFGEPLIAKTLKIVPKTWHDGVAVNFEIISCPGSTTTNLPTVYTSTYESITSTKFEEVESHQDLNVYQGSKASRIMIVPSHVSPLAHCAEENHVAIIKNSLPGSIVFNASSELNTLFGATESTSSDKIIENSGGSWIPAHADKEQWLSITLPKIEPIYGVTLQGNPSKDQYVTSYKILYSEDGQTFSYVPDRSNKEQVFHGPINKNTPVKQIFYNPIEAKVIRIIPQTWHNGIAIRAELIGCRSETSPASTVAEITTTVITTESTVSTTQHIERNIEPVCDDPLGLDDRMMSDEQVTASSTYDQLLPNLRLSSEGIWRPKLDNPHQYVEFDFYEPRNITGVETKGNGDIWTTAYKVSYSHDGSQWNLVFNDDNTEKQFLANYDGTSSKTNYFERPLHARYLRIQPSSWHNHIGLKVEIHGCYLPYPETTGASAGVRKQVDTISYASKTKMICNVCDGIAKISAEKTCPCKTSEWWDGESCVMKQECPCVVGHISYAVGSYFYTEDCQHCDCTLGGIIACQLKKCEPCTEPGLQSIVTKELCHCMCKPCPEKTRLCPTSNICINETAWCDGVQDCPDDEKECQTTSLTSTTTQEPTTVPTVVETITSNAIIDVAAQTQCQTPSCPPGYKVVLKQPQLYAEVYDMQQTSSSTVTKGGIKGGTKGGIKGGTKGGIKGGNKGGVKGAFVGRTKGIVRMNEQQSGVKSKSNTLSDASYLKEIVCPQFSCKSNRPPPLFPNAPTAACPEVQCPPGYKLIYEKMSFYQHDPCPRFMCKPPPPVEVVCNVTGRTFNTFDNIEYKYDICNHVLARDMHANDWYITLIKECDQIGMSCQRVLAIAFDEHLLFLYPDLHIDFDDFPFSPNQVKLLTDKDKAFKITRVGNSMHFVSYHYGFWIIWDMNSNVKVGVTTKLAGHVDGLCGFFDGHPENDRQSPDGKQARSTVDFGNSWAINDTPECEPQVCPEHVQEAAWAICNTVKHQSLAVCSGVVDLEKFISHCLETACNCLRGNSTEAECRCHELTAFVSECQAADSNIELSTWRTDHDCPAFCPTPFVHKDCFRHECEATCNNLQETDPCPFMPGVCFSGCFCPDGMVRRGDECVLATECRDCLCDGFGSGKFVTFDKRDLTFNGNCTYILSRDMPNGIQGSDGEHLYEVLITNSACPQGFCTEAITVLYNQHSVQVKHGKMLKELIVFVDEKLVEKFPYSSAWLTLIEAPGRDITLLIPAIQLEIASFKHNFAFMVKLPSHTFGGAMEGLCGDCDGNSDDDFRKSNGEVTNDGPEFGMSWLAKKLPNNLGLSNEECISKPKKECEITSPAENLCEQLLDVKRFGQCHEIIDPAPYFARCQDDLCEKSDVCDDLEAYARSCLQAGLCLNWRGDDVCPYKCPSHLQYRSCGPGCTQTCIDLEQKQNIKCPLRSTEGCFCPEDKILMNGTCIDQKQCFVCDKEGHVNGDVWNPDKCTQCSCHDKTITCEKTECPALETVCGEGLYPSPAIGTQDECCPKYFCIPIEIEATQKPCVEPQKPICGFGQTMKLVMETDGCQNYVCQCVPKEECEDDLWKQLELETEARNTPGMVKVTNTSGCCPVSTLVCKPETCPERPNCLEFHKIETTEIPGSCCPTYECKPEKNVCFYIPEHAKGTKNMPRETPKRIGEHWHDGLCKTCTCEESNGEANSKCVLTECTTVDKHPDINDYVIEEVLLADECCPTFERTACKYNNTVYYIGDVWQPNVDDACTTVECIKDTNGVQKKVMQMDCNTNCDQGYEYRPSEEKSLKCCGECVAVACTVDEKLRKIGEEWQSDDHCTKYSCVLMNGSLHVQSETEKCTTPSLQDLENFEIELRPVSGKCCPDIIKTGCRHNGTIHEPGQKWISPVDNCVTEMCVMTPTGIIKNQERTTCSKECALGWEYQEPHGQDCCGECKQLYCLVNEELYEPDQTWTSADKCTTFRCEKEVDQFIIRSSSEKCPDVTECSPEAIYTDGCCDRCNITALNQKKENCIAAPISSNNTIGVFTEMKSTHGLCKNLYPIEGLTECHGTCDSSTRLNLETWNQDSNCECCMPMSYESILVELTCEDNTKLKKRLTVPKECTCEACTSAKSRVKGRKSGTKG